MSKLSTIALTLFFLCMVENCVQEKTEKRKLKILFDNPAMAFSHMQFLGRLADVLVDAGHEVHMVVLNAIPDLANYTGTSKTHKIMRVDRPQSKVHSMNQLLDLKNPFLGVQNSLRGFSDFMELSSGFCEDLVNSKNLILQLKAENYDVGIAEFYHPCSFAIFHHIGVRTSLSALAVHLVTPVNAVFGIPILSSYVPNMIWPSINAPNMNFVQRAINLFVDLHDTLNLREYGQKAYTTYCQQSIWD